MDTLFMRGTAADKDRMFKILKLPHEFDIL